MFPRDDRDRDGGDHRTTSSQGRLIYPVANHHHITNPFPFHTGTPHLSAGDPQQHPHPHGSSAPTGFSMPRSNPYYSNPSSPMPLASFAPDQCRQYDPAVQTSSFPFLVSGVAHDGGGAPNQPRASNGGASNQWLTVSHHVGGEGVGGGMTPRGDSTLFRTPYASLPPSCSSSVLPWCFTSSSPLSFSSSRYRRAEIPSSRSGQAGAPPGRFSRPPPPPFLLPHALPPPRSPSAPRDHRPQIFQPFSDPPKSSSAGFPVYGYHPSAGASSSRVEEFPVMRLGPGGGESVRRRTENRGGDWFASLPPAQASSSSRASYTSPSIVRFMPDANISALIHGNDKDHHHNDNEDEDDEETMEEVAYSDTVSSLRGASSAISPTRRSRSNLFHGVGMSVMEEEEEGDELPVDSDAEDDEFDFPFMPSSLKSSAPPTTESGSILHPPMFPQAPPEQNASTAAYYDGGGGVRGEPSDKTCRLLWELERDPNAVMSSSSRLRTASRSAASLPPAGAIVAATGTGHTHGGGTRASLARAARMPSYPYYPANRQDPFHHEGFPPPPPGGGGGGGGGRGLMATNPSHGVRGVSSSIDANWRIRQTTTTTTTPRTASTTASQKRSANDIPAPSITAPPVLSFTANYETQSYCVASVVHSGARSREVGVALCHFPSMAISLAQYSDGSAFSKTVSLLTTKDPVEVILPLSAARSHFARVLLEHLEEDITLTGVQRCLFNSERGVRRLLELQAAAVVPKKNEEEEEAAQPRETPGSAPSAGAGSFSPSASPSSPSHTTTTSLTGGEMLITSHFLQDASDRYLCMAAAHALIRYMESLHDFVLLPRSVTIRYCLLDHFMEIPRAAARALEIIPSGNEELGGGFGLQRGGGGRGNAGGTSSSSSQRLRTIPLIDALPKACTTMGQRFLRSALLQPLRDKRAIESRYDVVAWLLQQPHRLFVLKQALTSFGHVDVERLCAELCVGVVLESPSESSGVVTAGTGENGGAGSLIPQSRKNTGWQQLHHRARVQLLLDYWDAVQGCLRLFQTLQELLMASNTSSTNHPNGTTLSSASAPPLLLQSVAETLESCELPALIKLLGQHLDTTILNQPTQRHAAVRSAGVGGPSSHGTTNHPLSLNLGGGFTNPARSMLRRGAERRRNTNSSTNGNNTNNNTVGAPSRRFDIFHLLRLSFAVNAPHANAPLVVLRHHLSAILSDITAYSESLQVQYNLQTLRLEPDSLGGNKGGGKGGGISRLYRFSFNSREREKAKHAPFTYRCAPGKSHVASALELWESIAKENAAAAIQPPRHRRRRRRRRCRGGGGRGRSARRLDGFREGSRQEAAGDGEGLGGGDSGNSDDDLEEEWESTDGDDDDDDDDDGDDDDDDEFHPSTNLEDGDGAIGGGAPGRTSGHFLRRSISSKFPDRGFDTYSSHHGDGFQNTLAPKRNANDRLQQVGANTSVSTKNRGSSTRRIRCSTETLDLMCDDAAECLAAIMAEEVKSAAPLFTALQHRIGPLQALSEGIGLLDTLLSFAIYASTQKCQRPTLIDTMHHENEAIAQAVPPVDSLSSSMATHPTTPSLGPQPRVCFFESRHPGVQSRAPGSARQGGKDDPAAGAGGTNASLLVPNTVVWDEGVRLLVITGPNMGGKTTLLRQVGQLQALAQSGCFIPVSPPQRVNRPQLQRMQDTITTPTTNNNDGGEGCNPEVGMAATATPAATMVVSSNRQEGGPGPMKTTPTSTSTSSSSSADPTVTQICLVDRILAHILCDALPCVTQSSFKRELLALGELSHAVTPQSLVLIDELGRSTNTTEGFSLAWACGCFLRHKRCRAIMTTHYAGLTELAQLYPKEVQNFHFSLFATTTAVPYQGYANNSTLATTRNNNNNNNNNNTINSPGHSTFSKSSFGGPRRTLTSYANRLFPGPCHTKGRYYGLELAQRLQLLPCIIEGAYRLAAAEEAAAEQMLRIQKAAETPANNRELKVSSPIMTAAVATAVESPDAGKWTRREAGQASPLKQREADQGVIRYDKTVRPGVENGRGAGNAVMEPNEDDGSEAGTHDVALSRLASSSSSSSSSWFAVPHAYAPLLASGVSAPPPLPDMAMPLSPNPAHSPGSSISSSTALTDAIAITSTNTTARAASGEEARSAALALAPAEAEREEPTYPLCASLSPIGAGEDRPAISTRFTVPFSSASHPSSRSGGWIPPQTAASASSLQPHPVGQECSSSIGMLHHGSRQDDHEGSVSSVPSLVIRVEDCSRDTREPHASLRYPTDVACEEEQEQEQEQASEEDNEQEEEDEDDDTCGYPREFNHENLEEWEACRHGGALIDISTAAAVSRYASGVAASNATTDQVSSVDAVASVHNNNLLWQPTRNGSSSLSLSLSASPTRRTH